MKDFVFKTPGTIISKELCSYDLETYRTLKLKGDILLVTDTTLVKLGVANKIKITIENSGSNVILYDKIEPEPKVSSLRKLLEFTKQFKINTVIGLGGGSPMDIAKLTSILIKSPQKIESIYGVNNIKGDRLPLILIPTTSGTGSEVTPVAVVTSDEGDKSPIVDSKLICDVVLLDANLTIGLPAKITAATGIDAIVHAIESYTSAVRKNPISDQLAKTAFSLLYKNIKIATFEGSKIESRESMLIGSMLAGLAFANSSVGAVHALSYPLGVIYNLPHGESNALVLVPIMRFNLKNAFPLYAELSRTVNSEMIFKSDFEAASLLINQLETLILDLKLSTKLSHFGIGEKELNNLTDCTLLQKRLLSYNCSEMSKEDIYQAFKNIL